MDVCVENVYNRAWINSARSLHGLSACAPTVLPDVSLRETTNVSAHDDSPKRVSDSVNAHHLRLILQSLVTSTHMYRTRATTVWPIATRTTPSLLPALLPARNSPSSPLSIPVIASPAAETSGRQAAINGLTSRAKWFLSRYVLVDLVSGLSVDLITPIRTIAGRHLAPKQENSATELRRPRNESPTQAYRK